MTMNPQHFRTFLAVKKHLNFTRAAEELFLSQPAISRQIQQLGRELGAPLFERIGKALFLTEAGRTLLPLAQDLLGRMERLTEAVREYGSVKNRLFSCLAATRRGARGIP